MKNIIKHLFIAVAMMASFASCKKDENRVQFEGGTNPVLTASRYTDPMVLLLNNLNAEVIKFDWTNPNYQFNTGLSSQNVTYTLQFDTVGANFSSPKLGEIAIANDLNVVLTSKQLNKVLVGLDFLELEPYVPHNIEVRVKASLTGNTVPLYSNTLSFIITPHEDPDIPRLYITGDGTPSGWTNAPPRPAQEFTRISGKKFEIEMDFTPGKLYKFLTKHGAWQPQWGGCGPAGGSILENPGGQSDPDAISTPADPGRYKITVDLEVKTCTVVRI